MPSDSRPLSDELATHAAFLRALARGMLADEHLAEDVVQQAFLRALARPPAARGFLRAWLARVVRHTVLNRARDEQRRHAREAAVARPELDGSAERAARELALQREVAAAVAELDEPYRTAVHLRYFRGLAPAAIARELGVPLKTVETRLTRAHARLRARLARAWGEQDERVRAQWAAALPAAKGIGVVLMTKQVVLIGVAAALLVGLVLTWRAFERAPERNVEAARSDVASAPALVRSVETPAESARETVGEERPAAALAPEIATAEASEEVELRRSLERLSTVLDRSLDGRLDPGAILDAALLVAAHDVAPPLPELTLGGVLAMPIVGLPEGVSAELNSGNPLKGHDLTLTIHMPRNAPFVHGGFERQGGQVYVNAHVDDSGELASLSISTMIDLSEEEAMRARQVGTYQYTIGAALNTSLTGARDWKLETTDNVGKPVGSGVQEQFVHGEPPQVLDGGPWPRDDDMRRFGNRLRELHELAKSRAGR